MIRLLRLEGDPVARGRAHGEAHAEAIRAYTEDRVHLATGGMWAGRKTTRADVLALAERMLPFHEAYSPALTAEMRAMAEAAGISTAEAVIVGGFTDFVDAVRVAGEDDCTAALVPASRGGGLYAQTWDMHDSATPHVLLLDLRPDDAPAALVFTTVGCIGQIGVNAAGISVGINNLSATDGRVGLTWPHVVRKVLEQTTLEAAVACVREAPLAGGHNYLLMDAAGRGVNIETSARVQVETWLDTEPIVHTNHCLAPETRAVEAAKDAGLLASSHERLRVATELLREGDIDVPRLMALCAEPTAVCRRSEAPAHIETSGAAVIRPATRELWACWGQPDRAPWHRFEVAGG